MANMDQAMHTTSELASEPLHYQYKEIFGHSVHWDTIVVTLLLILAAIIFSGFVRRAISYVPGRLQVALEMFIGFFDDIAINLAGERMRKYLPFVLSFFIFIVVSNLMGLIPPLFKVGGIVLTMPPTRDLNTTLALALVSFFTFQYVGYRENGLAYLKHYLHPLPDLMPIFPKWSYIIVLPVLGAFFITLNIIEELSRVLSLTMRLMGNILGEHIVAGVTVGLVLIAFALWPPLALVADMLPLLLQFIAVLTCVVQAFVFTLLSMSYIATAMEH